MNELTVTQGNALPADHNPAAVYLAGLSKGSRPSMQGSLDAIAQMVGHGDAFSFPWHELRFQHTAAIRSKLAETYAPATANKMLCALRGALKAAWRLGLMDAETYHRARDVEGVKNETLPAGRHIPTGELAAMLNTCANTAAGVRDAAIIALLYSCGLRRAELAALDIEDYSDNALIIRGKGRKERLAPVVNGAAAALADWLIVRGDGPGALFWRIRRGGHLVARRLTPQAVWCVLKKRAKLAGVADLTPHDFRRTFVGDLLDAGADISTVQQLAGHANVTTTARYDRRPEAAKRRAAELLHVPYHRRCVTVD